MKIKETRKCINCGKIWELKDSSKQTKNSKGKHIFCDECSKKLTKQEKQYYYRINSGYTPITFTCIRCNTQETHLHSPYKKVSLQHRFCENCCAQLDVNARRRFLLKNSIEYKDKVNLQKRNSTKKHIVTCMLNRAKRRALKCNLEFNLDETDIVIPDKCPILEVPLTLGSKGNYEYTPSIDRIDNSKGYIKGNIQIISKKANSMKNSASLEELKTFCTNILRYSLNNSEQ